MQTLIEKIEKISDPRRQWGNKRHKLVDILFIGFVSILCGGTDFEHMEDTGYGKLEWFKQYLELPNGIPDSDTFRRVFERLNPQEVAEVLNEVIEVCGKTVAIDGKTICGSNNDQHKAYHVISAWVAENQITLGQLTTDEKSNEITAIPKLLDVLDIKNSIVTLDAMGCQRDIAAKIIEKKADYILAVKKNQRMMYEDIKLFFDTEEPLQGTKTLEKDHGRIEKREYYLETDVTWLPDLEEWSGLKAIGMVRSTVTNTKTGKNSQETRYFITSVSNVNQFATSVRRHWSIENQLHWQLDVSFREDAARVRKDNSPLNLNIFRKQALFCLKQADLGKRVSIRRKMSRAAMDNSALERILGC